MKEDIKLTLRVVGYFEDGECVAHMLETDLVGVGSSPEEAEEDLKEAFIAQLSFCSQNNVSPFRPAPPEILALWDKISQDSLMSSVSSARPKKRSPKALRTSCFSYGENEMSGLRASEPFQHA